MPIPLNSVVEVAYEYEYSSQRYLNVSHWLKTVNQTVGTSITAELLELATSLSAAGGGSFLTLLRACLSVDVTVARVRCQMVDPTRSLAVYGSINASGTFGGGASQGNLSAVITRRTELGGRDQIGSWHMPAVPDGVSTLGFLNGIGSYWTALLTFANRLNVAVSGTGLASYDPVLWHNRTVPHTTSLLTSSQVQDTVRTMRRRTVGVGK